SALSPSAFFFFQAEDGIRALYVTGVQTCALPIWEIRVPAPSGVNSDLPPAPALALQAPGGLKLPGRGVSGLNGPGGIFKGRGGRSEERRVGKECSCRGRRWDGKRKDEAALSTITW